MSEVEHIELWPPTFDCWICGGEAGGLFVWAYEDIILPIDSLIENRCGQHVCDECYVKAARLTHNFTRPITLQEVR